MLIAQVSYITAVAWHTSCHTLFRFASLYCTAFDSLTNVGPSKIKECFCFSNKDTGYATPI